MKSITCRQVPKILIVKNDRNKLASNSKIIASFDHIYIPIKNSTTTLSWIQQHQPDVIMLDIELFQIVNLELISVLRSDWLTRNIPIILISNLAAQTIKSTANLDFDACLTKPYSAKELESVICSLVSNPLCEIYFSA